MIKNWIPFKILEAKWQMKAPKNISYLAHFSSTILACQINIPCDVSNFGEYIPLRQNNGKFWAYFANLIYSGNQFFRMELANYAHEIDRFAISWYNEIHIKKCLSRQDVSIIAFIFILVDLCFGWKNKNWFTQYSITFRIFPIVEFYALSALRVYFLQ